MYGKAEHTRNWDLHLQAVEAMFPYFDVANHFLCVKSARVYLQNMEHLETTNPNVFDNLQNGRYVIRRSDRFWASLLSDRSLSRSPYARWKLTMVLEGETAWMSYRGWLGYLQYQLSVQLICRCKILLKSNTRQASSIKKFQSRSFNAKSCWK